MTQVAGTISAGKAPPVARTIWGMDATQLHDRYWAARGVQVVRQGEPSLIVRHAEMFLLLEPRSLAIFGLTPLLEPLRWIKPVVLFVRLHDSRERRYRERVLTDFQDRFVKFQRLYDARDDARFMRVAVTTDREIARLWQNAPDALSARRRLRKYVHRTQRMTISAEGNVYDSGSERQTGTYMRDLVRAWRRPDVTIARTLQTSEQVWKDPECQIEMNAKFVGPVWVGAGRYLDGATTVIGPAVIWDDPDHRPITEPIEWLNIEAPLRPDVTPPEVTPLGQAAKRLFDLTFSVFALLLTLPLYPFIMAAVWLEDGRPIFFSHRRETMGGKEFGCVKFRSMRKDAEKIKAELRRKNQADGPQFFMEDDPRVSKVGKILRKFHLDELPQFFNVLVGDMSVVGPRPSPRHENQYCPAWREARLSVRPGITGLWQTCRTRQPGADFQEWIKYDIQYVDTRTFWGDMKIIATTFWQIVQKALR
ncbi:MAG TPA: sugar transferase [Tepidisphaeraceae bacterium]|jgi:lipopolysaccharide/colanic/teichoic acid biosynthesis glycosyltransferase